MKILIVSKRPTHPTDSGSRRFILNQVELFKGMGHDVYYLYIHENWSLLGKGDQSFRSLMQDYWGDKLTIYNLSRAIMILFRIKKWYWIHFCDGYQSVDGLYPLGLTTIVKNLNRKKKFDCCIVNYYELTKLFCKVDFSLKGITTHDYFSYKSLLVGNKSISLNTTAHEEAKAMQRCPHIFALNSEEAIFFKKLSPLSKVYNVYGIFKYEPSPIVGNHDLLFLSGNNIFNINGLDWFVNKVFPEIVKKYPDARLKIGGGICEFLSRKYSGKDSIVLVGHVNNAAEFYQSADVAINPTYEGTGLKIKTFESVAFDKVTIVHPHSMIGVYDASNAPLFASENTEDWVSFLDRVWTSTECISSIKSKNNEYICRLNRKVESEYQKFFAS